MFRIFIFLVLFCSQSKADTKIGKINFFLEKANTPEAQEKGLMFRKALCEKCGMLFDFGTEKKVAMWMKNTTIPLDMLFFDSKKILVFKVEKTQPYSLMPLGPSFPIRYVVELNAGDSKKYGLERGDLLQ